MKQNKATVSLETGQSNSPKQSSKNKREREKSEDSIWDFEDNIKRTNIHSTGVPEGKEREEEQKYT